MSDKKFSNRAFRVEPLLASKAMVLRAKVMRLAEPALMRLGEIMRGHGKDKTEEEKSGATAALMSSFMEIFSRSDPEEVAGLIKEVCEIAIIKRGDGQYYPVDFDGDFTQHQGDILPVAVWVLREQFADFFSGLQDIFRPAK